MEITRRFEIDAGHRVYGHDGKCASLHGHRYVVEVHVEAPVLDHLGRVVDFGVIKEMFGRWLDRHWDHAMLLWKEDPVAWLYDENGPLYGQQVCILPFNPTAENMADYLLNRIAPHLLVEPLVCTQVVVRETPNCWAKATLDD
ncbi:hypothetical protein LCGC14_1912040 [marine sediment metagenome]|uniref:6-pyruvoyl tetrahydrobiopterin synthase n=1 Tax=marine sediment metagenome TaxID=412755 RepID=A0A0F9IRC7_9ZZZZ